MKDAWEITVPSEETERIAITYGDPADALIATENYALNSLPDAITNWHALVPLLKIDHWYDVTAFYSRRKSDLSKESEKMLFEYNQQAFEAAKTKGGLLLYFQGVLIGNDHDKTSTNLNIPFVPNCLSFCIWETLWEAKAGAKIPEHKKAVQMISRWYEGFSILKYQVALKQSKKGKKILFKKVAYN